MDIYSQLAKRIIEEQETIIGPVALEQAKKVPGMSVDWQKKEVTITGDEKNAVASVQVCKDAVKSLVGQVPVGQLPPLLAK
jgi:hypothetical protein